MPEHHVIASRVSDGKQLWRASIAPGKSLCRWHEYAAPTPATDGKALYVWFGSGVAAAVDFEGNLIWREQRDGVSMASDLLNPADGLLYYVSAGTSVIVRGGPKFVLVAVNNLGGGDAQCGPSAAVSNGRLFVRDFEFLYCIGQPAH